MHPLDGPDTPTRIQRWERLGRQHRGSFRVFDLYEDRVRAPHSGAEYDFVLIEARDWVNVIPVTPDGRLVFVRQYRHGTDSISLEIPGGVTDAADASPEVAARREMREETGFDSERLIHLGSIDPNPALFNNRCHIYLAPNAKLAGAVQFDETEDIEVMLVNPGDVRGLILSGRISHALVVAAFYLYEAWKQPSDANAS